MEALLKKFAIEARLDSFSSLYERACEEYRLRGDAIMNFEKYNIFTYMKNDITRIKNGLLADSDNVLFCYLLNAAIRAKDNEAIAALSSPRVADESELYDSISLFALLYELPRMQADHRRRRIPADVTAATMEMFQNQVGDYILLYGRHGLRTYVRWMMKFVNCEILRVGRFNLEMCKYGNKFDYFECAGELKALATGVSVHRSGRILGSADSEDEEGSFFAELIETEDYYEGYPSLGGTVGAEPIRLDKSQWKRVLTEGDKIVSVHIPTGGPLTPEVVESDLLRGAQIIEQCYTDFEFFYCNSWLLDTELKAIIGKEGNVTRFGDRYTRFPIKSNAMAVYTYVFDSLPQVSPCDLPEKNSFAKAIKNHLVAGGRVYGAAGAFRRLDPPKPSVLIPRPAQIVVDDVGWFNGKDDRANGGPSRTGMPRRHVAEDIRALNDLGERLGMKINCAFIVGEWDPDNRLSVVPHLSKYGENWDNASYLDREEMARIVEAINESPYVDIALHGLLHGYYMDGVDNCDCSDYYYAKGGEITMVPADEIRLRVRLFRELLEYYGIKREIVSFVPPSFRYRWNELSGVLCELGFKYGSTIFATLNCENCERPSIVGVENGIVTVDRNINIYPWDSYECPFDDIPSIPGILGAHWPNFLHSDPARNGEIIDKAVKYFKMLGRKYGIILSRGIEFSAVQSMYHRFAAVEYGDRTVTVDISAISSSPVAGQPLVVSATDDIIAVTGGSVRLLEDMGGHKHYEILPSSDRIEIRY